MYKYNLFSNKLLYFYKQYSSTCKQLSIVNISSCNVTGEKIKIQGWVKSIRKMKEHTFFDLSDGSCDQKLQVLIPQTKTPSNLSAGSSITVSGVLKSTPKGQIELNAEDIEIYSNCAVAEGYPFAPRKSYTPEYVRQYIHLRSRTNKFASILRVRDAATMAIHDFFHDEGFISVHTPILTSNDCEGAGEVFTVQPESKELLKQFLKPGNSPEDAYFDSKVFLTVSGQLHLEAVVHGLSKVYTFGPIFRAENSRSRLHLSEFYMLEAELAFIDTLQELLSVIERLIKRVTSQVLETCADDVERCRKETQSDLSWLDKDFIILTFNEAESIIENNKDRINGSVSEKNGFSKEQELFLVEFCGAPVFIINWPASVKPFYMKTCTDNPSKVAAMDLLVPNTGEIVGGSLRENDYNTLRAKLPANNTNLDWYLELRKFGGVPTGGFGLGFERYLQFLLGINNIKDAVPFPRWPHNCRL